MTCHSKWEVKLFGFVVASGYTFDARPLCHPPRAAFHACDAEVDVNSSEKEHSEQVKR